MDEHPFATFFDVHQGYRVLTHSYVAFGRQVTGVPRVCTCASRLDRPYSVLVEIKRGDTTWQRRDGKRSFYERMTRWVLMGLWTRGLVPFFCVQFSFEAKLHGTPTIWQVSQEPVHDHLLVQRHIVEHAQQYNPVVQTSRCADSVELSPHFSPGHHGHVALCPHQPRDMGMCQKAKGPNVKWLSPSRLASSFFGARGC